MAAYEERYPRGTPVVTADAAVLREFRRTWKYHHPLSERQVVEAGRIALVGSVSFYHGGDVLYELIGLPGTWHETCLRAATAEEIADSPPPQMGPGHA